MPDLKKLLFLTALMFVFPATAHTYVRVTPTLEWQTDHSSEIGLYKFTNIVADQDNRQILTYKYIIVKTFRGVPPNEINDLNGLSCARIGDEILIFFKNDHLTPDYKINVTYPETRPSAGVAISHDLQLLKSKEGILRVVLDRLAKHPQIEPPGEIHNNADDWVAVDFLVGDVYFSLWGGSDCFIIVPKDLRAKTIEIINNTRKAHLETPPSSK